MAEICAVQPAPFKPLPKGGHERAHRVERGQVDADGSGEIGFDEFLQLMRKFIDQSMAEQLLKERDIIAKTRFDQDEVAQWREVLRWW